MINEYEFIYCFYIIIVFLVGLLFRYAKSNNRDVKIILFILILFGSLIAAFRPENTQDTAIYNMAYQESLNYLRNYHLSSVFSLFANRSFYSIELLYVIIMACFRFFFSTPFCFYFIQGIITNSIMVQGLYLLCKYLKPFENTDDENTFFCKSIMLIYAFYQLFCGLLYTSSAVRSGLSISLGIFAIASLLLKKRIRLSVFLIIVSVLIHTTSIVLVFIYFVMLLWKIDIKKNYVYILSVGIPFLYVLKIGAVLVGFVTIIVERILQLFNIQAFYSYLTLLDYQLPKREGFIIVVTCLLMLLLNNRTNESNKFIAVIYLGLIIYIIAYPIPALARLLYMFIIFLIPLALLDNKNDKLIQFSWILYFIPQYVYVFGYLNN